MLPKDFDRPMRLCH